MADRAVYDANVLFEWLVAQQTEDGLSHIRALKQGNLRLILTRALERDARGGFANARDNDPETYGEITDFDYHQFIWKVRMYADDRDVIEAKIRTEGIRFEVPQDRADNHLAEATIAAQARYLISYDHHLLALRFHPDFRRRAPNTFVVRPNEFEELYGIPDQSKQVLAYQKLCLRYLDWRESNGLVKHGRRLTKLSELLGYPAKELVQSFHRHWRTDSTVEPKIPPSLTVVRLHKKKRRGGPGEDDGPSTPPDGGAVPPSGSAPPKSAATQTETIPDRYFVEASMLSIQACGGGASNYYLSATAQEYYLSEGDASLWLGRGADKLALTGRVEADEFKQLLDGYDLDGTKLVQNAGKANRKTGWDLTFSAPKSVGVLWATGDPDLRAKIEKAHLEAVRTALDYLEGTAAVSRREKQGIEREPVGLVVAAFHHGTSRNLDPQPHTHCVVLNVGVRPDGTVGALVSKEFYRAKMAAGAVYQAKLATELERLGLRSDAVRNQDGLSKGYFELVGIPKSVRDAFSSRRQEIEAALQAKGFESAAAAEFANLETRPGKSPLPPRDELFRSWRERAEALGFGQRQVAKLFGPVETRDQVRLTAEALWEAKQSLTEAVSYFTERELFRETLIRTIGRGVSPEFVQQQVRGELGASKDIVALGRNRGEHCFTTKGIWETEKHLLESVDALRERKAVGVEEKIISSVLDRLRAPQPGRPGLLDEQKEAARYLTQDGGAIRVLSGYAGTGKTRTLEVVREAYEKDGYRVLGASVAGIAAQNLEKGSGIKSDTVAMRHLEMERSLGKVIKHHATQLARAALKLPTFKLDPKLTIDKKTVLVVDEAGMLGTKDLARLVDAVVKGGGRLILVGDHRQLPPIGPGGGFRAITERVGGRDLVEIARQQDAWARQKAKDLAHGDAEKAMRAVAEEGKLFVGRDREQAVKRLVSDWAKGGVFAPKDHVMIAGTNAEVGRLNRDAQAFRMAAALVGGRAAKVGDDVIMPGDRVVFTKKSRVLGVENGSLGTVMAVSPNGKKIAVTLDGEKETKIIPIRKYNDVRLGYALTVHRAQGATFENTYVQIGGTMTSREFCYVAGSRERQEARFYTDRFEAGDDLAQLAEGQKLDRELRSNLINQMTKTEEKRLAHEQQAQPYTRTV